MWLAFGQRLGPVRLNKWMVIEVVRLVELRALVRISPRASKDQLAGFDVQARGPGDRAHSAGDASETMSLDEDSEHGLNIGPGCGQVIGCAPGMRPSQGQIDVTPSSTQAASSPCKWTPIPTRLPLPGGRLGCAIGPEVGGFPFAKHDGQVDALSLGFNQAAVDSLRSYLR
jgi:hypothetical protein